MFSSKYVYIISQPQLKWSVNVREYSQWKAENIFTHYLVSVKTPIWLPFSGMNATIG